MINTEPNPEPIMLPEPFTTDDIGPDDDVIVTRVRGADGAFRTTQIRLIKGGAVENSIVPPRRQQRD